MEDCVPAPSQALPPPPFLFHAKTEVSGEAVVTDTLVLHHDSRGFGMTNVFSHPRYELYTAAGMKLILAQFIP